MVFNCVVLNCRSEWYPACDIIFHKFPSDPNKREKWLSIVRIRRPFFEKAKICNLHFKKSDYDSTGKRLRIGAIPFYKETNVSVEVVKINKWDGAAAKNAIDDAIREVLTGDLKCKESFALIDGRLFLCALAVGVALYALLWDYLYPFPQSRLVLIICVTSYFVLMGILTLYTTFKEKGIFVVAKEKVGNAARVWEASSYVKKHDDKYNLILVMRDASGKIREASINKSFGNYIDTNGTVVHTTVTNEVTKLYNSLSSEKKEK